MTNELVPAPIDGQLLIYEEGDLKVQVRIDGQTVWLTQRAMAELYQTSIPNINKHLSSIFEEGELAPEATIKKCLIVQAEGSRQVRRAVDHYNLDAVLAVGYRVRSARGTVFRQWATTRLSELLVKGFTLDDERIKAGRTLGDSYFDDLLDRIRGLAGDLQTLVREAARRYAIEVEAILAAQSRDPVRIERCLDGMLDFAFDDDVLALYKKLWD